MLALIAERVSGVPFPQLVQQRVCAPAGMRDTGFLRSDGLRTALGYLATGGEPRTNVFHLPVVGSGDGGIYSTAADISALWRSLFASKIVPTRWVAEMVGHRSGVPAESMRYGLGGVHHAALHDVVHRSCCPSAAGEFAGHPVPQLRRVNCGTLC